MTLGPAEAVAVAEEAEGSDVSDLTGLKEKHHPRLVVCEGGGDEAVLRALLKVNQIEGVQVATAGGRSKFHTYLRAARLMKFSRVLLVSDEDENAANNAGFNEVLGQLRKAGYATPARRRQALEPANGYPGVEILMIPWDGEDGCLETVCLPAFECLYPSQYACLDALARCAGTGNWPDHKKAEMKVQALLTVTQTKNPRIGLSIFAKATDCPLDFKHACFDRIRDYLLAFSQRQA